MRTSTLELAVGGLPFPHGREDGSWCYRHAVRPEGHTALDAQSVTDFLAYEATHARAVSVIADSALSDWETWTRPVDRQSPGDFAIQCCTHAYPEGCGSRLVCHGAPPSAAVRILEDDGLRAASDTRHAGELAARSTWGEPADYFEHVMFANGRCTAPEAVALSRALGRDLVPSELGAGYTPAVRFYFDWSELARRDDARFDGVHPVKIERSLSLDDVLVAVVIHASQSDVVRAASASGLRDRIVILSLDDQEPHQWATASCEAALGLSR